MTITGITQPTSGSVSIDDNGTPDFSGDDRLTYTPNEENNPSTLQPTSSSGIFRIFSSVQPFTDSFTYTVSDANGNSNTATVNVNVEPEFRLKFTLTNNQASFVNEVGVFNVDDELGTINGIAPREAGYVEAALSSGRVIFSTLSENLFDLNSTRILDGFSSDDQLSFFLVQNSTVDTALADLAAGQAPTNVFFASANANGDRTNRLNISDLANNGFALSWEDALGTSDADFNDLTLTVETTTEPVPIGADLQGRGQEEVLNLQNQLGVLQANFEVFSEAAFNNNVGLYVVQNEQGTVIDPTTGQSFSPGDSGYAQAALQQRINLDINNNTNNLATQLEGGAILAPYIIADGTVEGFLTQNPNNQQGQGPLAYFAYLGANSDRVDHIRLLGDNTFGFEDKSGGGDRDYNDIVFRASLFR